MRYKKGQTKDIQHVGFQVLIQHKVEVKGKKVEKFIPEATLFQSRALAHEYVERYCKGMKYRIEGMRQDFFPVYIPIVKDKESK